jgi:hypothetical protein
MQTGVSRLWFFTYSSDTLTDKPGLTPANFLELKPDNQFTGDLGKFQSGRWIKKDEVLILTGENGDVKKLLILELKSKEMQLKVGQTYANFDGFPLPVLEKDPFAKAKNLWRYKATGKETDVQIKQRLRNHCEFWASYFNWALESEMETVDVRSTPSPIKIYGNGFSIKSYQDLPTAWKEYFYDSADCRRASEILEDVVQTHTIAWAHTNNKYKMFISAFQQMRQFLK